jgi:hypothetical protein
MSEDPFAPQKLQQEAAKQEAIQFQRLCYEIFHMSDNGKKLYDMILKKYIIPAKFAPSHPNADHLALYWEGFKEAMRGLWDQGNVHATRVNNGEIR